MKSFYYLKYILAYRRRNRAKVSEWNRKYYLKHKKKAG